MAELTTLISFTPSTGSLPKGNLIFDANGDLFGIADGSGVSSSGTVFEVTNTASGYSNTPTVIAPYGAIASEGPSASLVADANGNLFGVTDAGGVNSDGTVFEIAKTATGYASTSTVLVNFDGTNGSSPATSLFIDAQGDLYGTTDTGGINSDGTVFEIANTASGYASTPTTLASFNGTDGAFSSGSLIADASGDLFGTTIDGGANSRGTVFELEKNADGYANTPTVLVSFSITTGYSPRAGLVADANGNLFGTTASGGASNYGTVFEIAKTSTGYASTPTVLVNFDGSDEANPLGSLIIDANGDLFGTTENDYKTGAANDGTVFEIPKTATGYATTPTVLVSFNGNDGSKPQAALIADANGNLFGTTAGGGTPYNDGIVFEITDSGYQVACFCRGTHVLTERGEVVVESLAIGDRVVTLSGATAPIRWIGCRSPRPEVALPVRVQVDAFGPGQPHRDLWLSPDHAIFSDGVLIPIRYLTNGATISHENLEHVAYYHVELDEHHVVLAEGLPCESYLDTGNRNTFANGEADARMREPLSAGGDSGAIWEAAGCAPLRIAGQAYDTTVTRLYKQAKKLGFKLPLHDKRQRPARHVPTTASLAELLRSNWYLATYPDVAAVGMDARVHYAGWGRVEGRLPCPESDLIRGLDLVDPGTFVFTMEDLVTADVDPVEHFCEVGWRERRRPNTYFDTSWYIAMHDVPAGMNPLLHYVLVGEEQGLRPSLHFDPSWYRRHYALEVGVSPLAHYLAHRRTQLFSPLPSFNVTAYIAAHVKTLRPNRDPYTHYLTFGAGDAADTTARLAA